MLKMVSNWNEVEPTILGEYERLEIGGHEVVIKNVCIHTSQTGNESLRIGFDIASSDKQAGYFQKDFDNNVSVDRKWSENACKYYSTSEEKVSYMKGLQTILENSNPNFKWIVKDGCFDEQSLIGLKACGVFGLEEYTKQNGEIGTKVKLTELRSLDKLKDVKIPKVKLIDNSYIDYAEYEAYVKSKNANTANLKNDQVDKFIENNLLD